MKRIVKLGNVAYLELTEQQFSDAKTIYMIDAKTNQVVCEAKEILLERGMFLTVPLSEFEEMEG